MSGICGLVNLDGAPVDPARIAAMAAALAPRGPDVQRSWSEGSAGLGHAMLRTTDEARDEVQPASLDGRTWIAADARIDGRAELLRELTAAGRRASSGACDADLILHAYEAWGERCLERLIGDFAFAIWDGARRRLFCARDHFGVKPFFYARVGNSLVFGSAIDALRREPGVSSELDPLAIADFLLFEMHQDPEATAFAAIRRLPPSRYLVAERGRVRTGQYWTLPLETRVRYRDRRDYVEHFKALLETAVADRLRCDRVAIELSGGLDSTAVAATACALLAQRPGEHAIGALTIVYDSLIPDEERRFAGLAAARLGIPIQYCAADGYALYERCGMRETRAAEPSHDPAAANTLDVMRQEAALARVVLTGWDGDAILNESPKPYLRTLLREGRWLRAAAGAAGYAISQRRIVPLGMRQWLGRGAAAANEAWYPRWLNPEFESRHELRERWRRVQAQPGLTHPVRPYAFATLDSIIRMSTFFEYPDPGMHGIALEYRHPLMDLRLQEYCLSIPPLPWMVKKHIVREAMRGVLPDEVLRRPKTPLAGSPEMELLKRPATRWVDTFDPGPRLDEFVDRSRIPPARAQNDPDEQWSNLRPLSLSFWLKGLHGMEHEAS